MTDNQKSHPHVPAFLRAFGIASAAGLAGLLFFSQCVNTPPPSPEEARRLIDENQFEQAVKTIDALLDQGDALLREEKESEAEAAFREARTLSHLARTRVLQNRIDAIRDKKEDGENGDAAEAELALKKEHPEYPFSIREAEASFYISGILFRGLRRKYADKLNSEEMGTRFVPPVEETESVRKEILEGLEANPDHKHLLRLLGILDNMTGRFGSAEKALTRAIAIDEHFAAAYNDLGLVYLNRGQFDKAQEQFKLAIAIGGEPEVTKAARYNLARFHVERYRAFSTKPEFSAKAIEQREQAVRYLKALLDEAKDDPQTAWARETLDTLNTQ